MTKKEFVVVGGSNGARNTTFANAYVANTGYGYISADAIAAQLSPKEPNRE